MPSNLVLQAFLIRFSCFLAYTAEIIREISDGLSGGSREIAAWAAAGPLGPVNVPDNSLRPDRARTYPESRTPKPVAASFSKTWPGARRSATLAALSSSSWASRAA